MIKELSGYLKEAKSRRSTYEHLRIDHSTTDLAIRTRARSGSAKLGDYHDGAGRGHLLGGKTTATQSSSSIEDNTLVVRAFGLRMQPA